MRLLMLFIAVCSLLICLYTVYNSLTNNPNDDYYEGVRAVEPQVPDEKLESLRQLLSEKISITKAKAEAFNLYAFILTLLGTAVTGLSTLVASLKAAKAQTESSGKALVTIAVLAFLATIFQAVNIRITELETEEAKKYTSLKTLRLELMAKYNEEQDPERRVQIIQLYEDQVSDL